MSHDRAEECFECEKPVMDGQFLCEECRVRYDQHPCICGVLIPLDAVLCTECLEWQKKYERLWLEELWTFEIFNPLWWGNCRDQFNYWICHPLMARMQRFWRR